MTATRVVARDADLARPSPAWMFVPMLAILMLVIVVGIAVVTSTGSVAAPHEPGTPVEPGATPHALVRSAV
jgi:hypothetical protein